MIASRTICRRGGAAIGIWLLLASAARGLDFPYVAYVNATDVYVRSGPGRDYYPTDKLPKGARVEVYRHDPGGWMAIRPPRGSFSWVKSRQLDVLEDDLAAVNSERVVARVGSKFSNVRDVIQVRLEQDEKVELIEPPAADSPWCRVAPPAGEFRWIFAKYVERQLPEQLADDERDVGAYEHSTDDAVGPDSAGGDAPAGELARLRQFELIDIELSAIVSRDIEQWSFDDLRRRTEAAQQAAQTSLERGRASVLLDKLDRFADIKRRHQDLAASGPDEVGPRAGTLGDRLRARRAADPRYDGVGRLSPVVSQRTGGPQYALLDATGGVRSFVTPAPGVNLRPYLDKHIGVHGQRSYLTDMQRQHISVQRVSVLETKRR